MKNNIIIFLCLICYAYFPVIAYAQQLKLYSSNAPPHMIESSKNGIDIDIIKKVLAKLNYRVNIIFSPLKRGMIQVENKKADLFLPTFFQPDNQNIYLSDAYIEYKPMIFSLKKRHFNITAYPDLQNKRIITFQGAKRYFGKKFEAAVNKASYTESHDMSIFPQLLLKERYDIVVLDYYIFYYFLKNNNDTFMKYLYSINTESLTTLIQQHDIIPSVNAYVGFNNKKLRDNFNTELKAFYKSPEYNKLIEGYIGHIHNFE